MKINPQTRSLAPEVPGVSDFVDMKEAERP
jgi:hypothetical protein